MHALLFAFQLIVAMGGVSVDSLSVSGEPFDISAEWRDVPLREPLSANTGNPRLILYIRDLDSVGLDRDRVVEQLPWRFAKDAVEAEVFTRDGTMYPLRMTGYSFFRGMPGLVLEHPEVPRGVSFYRLRLRSRTPVPRAVMIWLDSLGRSRPE